MRQEIIDLYDQYTHSVLDRRTFMERLAAIAGGVAAALALLPVLQNNYAKAALVPPDSPLIDAEAVSYPGAKDLIRAYQARPRNTEGKLPAVIVIHENRGLNPHTQDVARRLALAGYHA